jgi:pyruvate dehydrogenase E1 component alpha subunit
MDVLAVEKASRRAVDRIRNGGGPCFLELRTYRFRAHSMYDPDRYRDKAEIARWRERDSVDLLVRQLRADRELQGEDLDAMTAEVTAEIDLAVAAAESAPLEPVEDLTRFVYSEAKGAVR